MKNRFPVWTNRTYESSAVLLWLGRVSEQLLLTTCWRKNL